jgi:hypothetical protein
MAPQPDQSPAPAVNGTTAEEHPPIGPPSGLSVIRTQYSSEQSLRQMLKNIGYDEAREDTLRLKGVQLIDTVRQSLQLYVRSPSGVATEPSLLITTIYCLLPNTDPSGHLIQPRYIIISSA